MASELRHSHQNPLLTLKSEFFGCVFLRKYQKLYSFLTWMGDTSCAVDGSVAGIQVGRYRVTIKEIFGANSLLNDQKIVHFVRHAQGQ